MSTKVLCLLASVLFPLSAFALSTDREQPIEIHADTFNGDEDKQTAVYSGNVIVTQGSMNLLGARLELRLSARGYRQGTVTGNLARFRQQRDPKTPGVDEWVHAQAERIIYDEEVDTITLDGKARLARSENGVEKDITEGERIVYDMRNARSRVEGGVVNGQKQRVSTIIAPRNNNAKETKSREGADLSNATSLSPAKKD